MAKLYTLQTIAVGGLFGTAMMYTMMKRKYRETMFKTEYVQKSIELLEKYPSLDVVLGEPLKVPSIDMQHPFCYAEKGKLKTVLDIEAPKGKGKMFCWCSSHIREDNENVKEELKGMPAWRVDRLDLQIESGSYKDTQFTIFKNPDADPAVFKDKIS